MNFLRHLITPEQKPLGAKIVRNMVYSGVRLFILAPLPFLVIPYFLKKLGPAGYGTWAIFLAVSGVTSLVDLGLVITLSKHVAELYALKDVRSLARVINTGVALYLAIACSLALVLKLLAPHLASWLFLGKAVPAAEFQRLWSYLILLVVANVLLMLMTSVVNGLQRMDLTTALTSFNALASAGLGALLLSLGLGIRGLLLAAVIAGWLSLSAYIFVIHRLLPEIRFDLRECSWAEARSVLSFSVKTYVTQVAIVVHSQIEKFYLARFVGVVPVGWYEISSDLALKCRTLPSLVLAPLLPAASELHAQDERRRLSDLYFRCHKYLAFVGVPIVAFIALEAKRFVFLWLGPSLEVIAVPLAVLVAVDIVNLTAGPGYLILVAQGKLKPGLYSALLGIVLNVSLSLFLIRAYGFRGAVIGTSLALVIASVFFLILFRRETGPSFSSGVGMAYAKPIASSLVIIAVLWLLTHSGQPSWFGLVLDGALFSVGYLLLLQAMKYFDRIDLVILERMIPFPQLTKRLLPHTRLGSSLLSDPQRIETTLR